MAFFFAQLTNVVSAASATKPKIAVWFLMVVGAGYCMSLANASTIRIPRKSRGSAAAAQAEHSASAPRVKECDGAGRKRAARVRAQEDARGGVRGASISLVALWVLSDLHLADASVAPMFHEERQGAALASLCERVASEKDGELVLLGDVFDLTAMNPPEHGLPAFQRKLGYSADTAPQRSAVEMCRAAGKNHPASIAALAKLSARRSVTLVPGNHDHPLGSEEGRAALDAAGLPDVALAPCLQRVVADRRVVLEHGHEMDEDNARPGGHGETLTRVLHHAIVPMLENIPLRPNVAVDPERLVALRPEERMVPILMRWLEEDEFEKFTHALVELLVDNDALSRIESWFATPERLRTRLDDADDLWEQIGDRARCVLEGKERSPHDAENPDVLVYGHTHVPDWLVDGPGDHERLYVNLGSWTQRATDATGPLDETMPALRLSAPATGLRVDLEELGSGRRLCSFDAAHRPGGLP